MNTLNEDIEKLIAYNWDGELADYEELYNLSEGEDPITHALNNWDNNHIFCTLARLHIANMPTFASTGSPTALADVVTDMFKDTPILYHPIKLDESNSYIRIIFKNPQSVIDAKEFLCQEENWVYWAENSLTLLIGLKPNNFGCPECGGLDVELYENSHSFGEIQLNGKIRFFDTERAVSETTCSRCGSDLCNLEEEPNETRP